MQMRKKLVVKTYVRTVGNLAIADKTSYAKSWQPKVEDKRLRLVGQSPIDGIDDIAVDSLATCKGIITGISVSMILWSLLLLSFGLNIHPVFPLAAVVVLMLVL